MFRFYAINRRRVPARGDDPGQTIKISLWDSNVTEFTLACQFQLYQISGRDRNKVSQF